MSDMMKNQSLVIQFASKGTYSPDCLRLEDREIRPIKNGEVLIRTKLVSIDPTSRNWLKMEPSSNAFGLAVGSVMLGQTVGEVVESQAEGFAVGDMVTGLGGWESYSVLSSQLVRHVQPDVPLEANLSIFSHIGLAAVTGLNEIGGLKADDTVVVSGAAGATGSLAVQIASAHGARVIGIAGGVEKCRQVVEDFGAEAAIDYKASDVEVELRRLCPEGVTLFFDNVGGAILDAVLMNLALHSRVAVCGQIALYNSADRSDGQGVRNLMELVFRRVRMEGFIAGEPMGKVPEMFAELARLYAEEKITSRPHMIGGLENAPAAIELLFRGENTGKLIISLGK